MPDKKYLIEIPDMPDSSGVWDADKWERNKDKFMQKYPTANVFELGAYDPNDMDENDQFMLTFDDDEESSGVWDAAKWERNKDKFLAKYPDAHVNRVRYMDYWGDKAKSDQARIAELQKPDEERNARLAEIGYYDDSTGMQVDYANSLGLSPLSSAIEQNSVSGEVSYLDPRVEEFFANDTEYTDKQMELNRLRDEYEANPRVIEQREYEAQMARYAEELEKQIKADMEADVDAYHAGQGAGAKHMQDASGANQTIQAIRMLKGEDVGKDVIENEKQERYASALKLLQQAKDARNVAGKGMAGGVADTAKDWARNLGTQSDIEMYNEVGNILTALEQKVGNLNEVSDEVIEENLTNDEKALIRAFFEYNAAMADAGEDMSIWYKGGKIFAESIPFMMEFLVTGGLANSAGRAATSWMGKGFGKWIAKSAKGTAARAAKKAVAKTVSGVAKTVVAAGARTLVAPTTYKNIAEQSVQYGADGHLDREGNMVKAAVDSYIEQLSEMSGAAFGKVLGGVGRLALGKTAFEKVGAWFGNNAVMQNLSKLGFHGLPEEVGEEIFGNALRTITGVDKEALSRMFEKDEFASMIIGFAPMTLFGAGMSVAKMGAASIGAANAGRRMRQDLSRSYTEEQIDQVEMALDEAKDANEIANAIRPIIMGMQAAGAPLHEVQSVWDYAIAVAKKKAMVSAQSAQEMQLAQAKIGEAQERMGGRFWIEDKDGVKSVKQVVLNNGNTAYVVSEPDQDGRVAIINATTGQKGTALPEDIKEESWNGTLNAFGTGLVMADRTQREQQRMQEDRAAQINEVRNRLSADPRINVGTEGSPIYLVAQSFNDAGVRYVAQDGSTGNISWEQAADSIGMPIVVKTDAQIAQEEAETLVAAAAERRAKRAKKDAVGTNERDNAVVDAENAVAEANEAARHIPMNEDGTVNEAAFWEQSPEEYVKWNDEQNQDGGQDSLQQVAIAKQELMGLLQEANAAQNTSNPTTRKAAKKEVERLADRIARLDAIEQSYAQALEEEQAAVQQTAAAPTSSMSEEDLESMDAQYQGILGKTRVQGERVRVMQEYLDKLAEGSVSVVLLTRQNYEEKLKEGGLPSFIINKVKQQVDAGKPVAGFMARGKVYLMEDGLSSIEEARVTYVHERQHTFNSSNPQLVQRVANALGNEESALAILKSFVKGKGIDSYKDDDLNALADEIICRSMEIAYTTEDFSVDLQSRGIPSEVISIIAEIDNEQRQDQSLSHARRRSRRNSYADVSGAGSVREDGRDFRQVSEGVLEQEETRPSGASGRGTQIGEGGEPAEVNASDDENAPLRIAEEAELDPETILNEDGFEADEQNEDVRFSVRYLPTPEQREGIIDSIIQITGRTKEEAERWLESELSLVPIVLNDKEYLDYAPDSKYKAIKDNSDYPQGTVDFNNICRKRKDFTRMYTRLQRAYPNRIFTAEDLADIRTIMSEDGLVVACGLCYVEDRRQKLGEVADEFIKDLQDGFKSYGKKNATKRVNAEKFRSFVGADTYVPSIYDLITLEGSDRLHDEHKGIWDAFGAYNRARGQQTQNTFQGYAEYKREILTWSDAKVKKVNSLGGLRIFSYSDFEAHHLLDIIQIIIDCAARGVMIQGYTKVPEFARVVEKTGIKLNRSLIPLGDTGIVDGKLAYDPVEGIDINDPNFLESNDNVGNILIGINDEQIRMAMADPFIHYIIPYHARQAGNIRAKLNVGAWTNYIDTQNERKKSDGKRVEKNINIYTDVLNESITNDREFVEKYLEVCREKGYIPKFDQFLDRDAEGNYMYTPGYYKFLVDFKLFDEAGNILPQKPVVAQFDDAFNAQVLLDYAREERETAGEAMNSTYDKIVETLDLGEPTVGEDVRFEASEGPIDLVEEAKKAQANDLMFRFIGEKAAQRLDAMVNATTMMDNLQIARDMEAQLNPDWSAKRNPAAMKIKMATGWERGVDGMWRKEMEDFEYRPMPKRVKKTYKLSGLIKDSSLFVEYPELKDIEVKFKKLPRNTNGQLIPVGNSFRIELSEDLYQKMNPDYIAAVDNFTNEAPDRMSRILNHTASPEEISDFLNAVGSIPPRLNEFGGRDTLAHEIQHAIQHIEGFAIGGNVNMVDARDSQVAPFFARLGQEMEEAQKLLDEYNDLQGQLVAARIVRDNVQIRYLTSSLTMVATQYKVHYQNIQTLQKLLRNFAPLGESGYHRLSGEVEARNVAERLDMSPEERRESLIADTQDVAHEDQIILRNYLMTDYAADTLVPGHVKGQPMLSDVEMLSDVSFRISNNTRRTIEGWCDKAGLAEDIKEGFIDHLEYTFDDTTEQLCAAKWYLNGTINLPNEDEYKVVGAVKVAKQNKVDPLLYYSPMDIFEKFGAPKEKLNPINPDKVSTLKNKTEVPGTDITIYDVEESEESRKNMREIINTHYGKNASPWCLLQGDAYGNLSENSAEYWERYSAYPKQVAFKNGRLLAFSANSSRVRTWWDRMDRPYDGVPVAEKLNDAKNRRCSVEIDPKTGKEIKRSNIYSLVEKDGYTIRRSWNEVDGPMISAQKLKDDQVVAQFNRFTRDDFANDVQYFFLGRPKGIDMVFTLEKSMMFYENGELESYSVEGFRAAYARNSRKAWTITTRESTIREFSFNRQGRLIEYFDGQRLIKDRKTLAQVEVPSEYMNIVRRDPKSFMAEAEQLLVETGLAEAYEESQEDIRFRVLDTTKAELKEKPIKLNGMYRFNLKNAFKGVKDNGGSYPYIKVQLEEVSDDYSGEKIEYDGILQGFAVVRIPKGLITEGEKDNVFFIDPKAIENELWDVLRATENYYEFKHGGAPYQRDWLNADVRFRMSNNNQAIFVSNAARAVEGIKQEKATPEQWLKMLEKAGGLKAGEDKWMGLSDWLKASKAKTLTKQEVLDFINENMIIIEEQHYSDEEVAASAHKELNDKYPGWEDAFSMDWDTYMDEPYAIIWDNEAAVELYNDTHEDQIELDEDGEFENLDDESKVMDFGKELAEIFYRGNSDIRPIHGTRSDYQTRGLSNNHEIALTVPNIESWKADDVVHFGDAGDGRAIAWIRFGETKYRPAGIADEIAALDKAIFEYEGETSDEEYKALVEKKHSLLRASRAQKVLVIDEIQSKRHQEGREKGYKSSASKRLLEEANALSKQLAEFEDELRAKYKIKGAYSTYELMPAVERKGSKEDYERYIALNNERNAKYAEYEKSIEGVDRNAPFDAPFDKNWHELAMKRMLRYAAENGYDVIAWTTGDQQASRYDLSKMVKKISVYPSKDGSRIVDLHLVDRENDFKNLVVDSEGMVTFGEYKGRALADVVGKDYSMKIMAATRNTEFSGDNLQVGGEGMRGFYDKMLPAFMNKYGKRWGVKVEDIDLPNLGRYGYTMHSIPVTEEMKASVMEGQVMFRMRGENESAMDFYQSELDAYKAKYVELGTIELYPINQETADKFGYTLKELEETGGVFVEDDDLIAIFVHEDAIDGIVVENNIFHEDVHYVSAFYTHMYQLGEWLWNNVDVDKAFADYRADIEKRYKEEDYHKEMLAYVVADAMSGGKTSKLEVLIPKEYHSVIRKLENEIGYDRRTEESSRESERILQLSDGPASQEAQEDSQNAEESAEETRFRTTEITPEVREEMDAIHASAILMGNFMKAPNGQPTNLTEEQWLMVRTKNFKNWFGDWENDPENASKVVDENGEPKVVYHGSAWRPLLEEKGNAVFKMRGGLMGKGAYFTDNIYTALYFAAEKYEIENNVEDVSEGFLDENGYVTEVFLNIRNEDNIRTVLEDTYYLATSPSQIKSATDNTGEFSEGEGDIRFSIRTKPAPKKTGKGYKVFYLKDGKLYPPMVANLGGVDTPVGVWLDAEEGTRAGVSKTGRPKVKQGGKGTQGGSGTLAYRPGWHLGEIPYAIQFNRKDENGNRTLFPADFVWAEVEYANDVDYQEEAMSYGMNANGKFQHSLAGLPKLPTDGSYRYRTNPNPETDPWIITGAMKVNRLLTPSEVDQMVIDAGREPQKRQEGAVTDAQIEALNKDLGLVEEEEEVSFRTTGTPTEDVVAEGVSLSPAQLASLTGDIFAALPEDSRKKITDGLNGNILGLQDAILQIPTSLATKEEWNDEDRQMAEVVAEQMTKAVGIEMTRPFSASEALWTLYNAVNKSTDLVSEASRALVRRNLGMGQNQSTLDSVQFRIEDSFENIDEIVNNGKQKVSEENSASAIELMSRLNAINATLTQLRSITAAQRAYDKATVKIVSDLANELLEKGALSDMTRSEIKRLLSAIKDAVGKKDLAVSVERLMDVMIANQLRHGRDRFKDILKIRDKRVDQRGIEVRGRLDVNGQRVMDALREGIGLDLERLEDRINETLNKMFDASDVVKKNAENELAGYELAKLYLQNIKESEQEEKDLRKELKDAKEVYDGGGMSKDAYREFVQSIYAAIRENRMQRVNDYANLFAEVTKMVTESTAKASLLRDAEKARVERIHHYANSDMQGMPSVQQGEVKSSFWNNTILRFLFKPLATFDQMLRSFAPKSRNGEGYLWNHFMGGWLRSSENEFKGIQAAHEQLDAKVRSMFAGVKRWSDLFSIEKKLPTMEVKFWDGEKMADFTLTQGNLLYIYMVNKMSDGEMKLRKMGITEEDVSNIARELDPRFIELADWIQDTFLPGLREKYNTLHEKMFGAPMAAIDNYFPIRVLANARTREVDLAVEESSAKPSTITGSIIKRTKNSLALDILGSDAFDVVLEHIEQMEHWAAFAEFNRDLNTLLSYRKFRNRVQNMRGIYGAGTTVWNNFRSVAEIAAGVYKPAVKGDSLDKLITNIAKGVTGAKISFRVYTALKQFLSAPAFVSDASAAALIKSLANPYKAWTWAMKELPLFEKRWKSRQAGDSRLMETESDWKLWKNKIVELAGRYGMTPNAFVDALTVSIGARAIYETKRKEYVKLGYTQDQAEEKAKRDATVLYNESQQSNESAFLSAAQVDRTVASILITVFRNSSMGYQRMYVDALRNIKHMLKKGYKAESLEYMKKQMMRDGLTEDQAERAANRIYNKSFARSATRLATFGFLVQFAWNLGPYMAYLLMGDDDEEKKDMIKDAAVRGLVGGPVEGLAAGQAISGVLGDFAMSEEISDPMLKLPATSDMESIFRQLEVDPVRAVNDIFNLVIQSGIGVNPQTLTDAVVAIIDGCNGDLETSKEAAFALMRILQTPQSQIEKLYMEEIDFTAEEALDMSVREFAERYAKYKVMRTAPLTKWMYSDEKEKELEDKYIKTFTKKASEMERTHGTEEAQEFFEYYDSEYEETAETLRDLKKQLKEAILDSDTKGEAKANEDIDSFLESEEFKRFEELLPHIKAYEAYRKALKTIDDPKMRSEYAEKMIQERNAAVEKLRGE